MTEKFSDLLQFTTQVSRLMVTEIRRRASNKSTGEPADALIRSGEDEMGNTAIPFAVGRDERKTFWCSEGSSSSNQDVCSSYK